MAVECFNCSNFQVAALQSKELNPSISTFLVYDLQNNKAEKYLIELDRELDMTLVRKTVLNSDEVYAVSKASQEWSDTLRVITGEDFQNTLGYTVYDVVKSRSHTNNFLRDYNDNSSYIRLVLNALGFVSQYLNTPFGSIQGMPQTIRIMGSNGGYVLVKIVATGNHGFDLEIIKIVDSELNEVPMTKSDLSKNSPYFYGNTANGQKSAASMVQLSQMWGITVTYGGGDEPTGTGSTRYICYPNGECEYNPN